MPKVNNVDDEISRSTKVIMTSGKPLSLFLMLLLTKDICVKVKTYKCVFAEKPRIDTKIM